MQNMEPRMTAVEYVKEASSELEQVVGYELDNARHIGVTMSRSIRNCLVLSMVASGAVMIWFVSRHVRLR